MYRYFIVEFPIFLFQTKCPIYPMLFARQQKGSRREHKVNICIRQWQGHPFWLPNPPFRPPLHLPLSVQDSPDFSLARTVDMEWNPSSNYFIPASVSALTICTIVAQFICTRGRGRVTGRGRGREWEGVWANEQLPITTSFVNVSFETFLSWRTHTHTMPFGTRGPLPKMGFSLRGCDFSGWDLRIGTPEHSRVLCTQDKPTSVNFNEVSKWEVHHHQQQKQLPVIFSYFIFFFICFSYCCFIAGCCARHSCAQGVGAWLASSLGTLWAGW